MAVIPGIILFLHDLFTAVWIGGLFFLVVILFPTLKKQGKEAQKHLAFVQAVQLRLRIFVGISILGLWITGMLLTKSSGAGGLFQFSTPYQILLSIKHLLILAMLGMVAWRLVILTKMQKHTPNDAVSLEQKLQAMRRSMLPVFLNLGLGLAVLFLTGLLSVV